MLTAIGVSLGAVAVLEAAGPRALVSRRGGGGLPYPVATLEALSPFSPIKPAATSLHPQAMPLAVLPLPLVCRSAEMRLQM